MKFNSSNQKRFEDYLKYKRQLSDSSVKKYARQSHNRIQKDLGISFYAIETMLELHQLLKVVKELEYRMERNPKRMYSSAVSNYIKFLALENEGDYLSEEANYLSSIEEELTHIVNSEWKESLIQSKPPAKLIQQSTQLYQRDRRIGAEAIRINNHLCQINPEHSFFVSRTTHKNYVEAHHIIPISTQALFEYSIDCVPNIACLCPACHRQIHFGYKKDQVTLLEVLWEKGQMEIKKAGIDIKFREVVEMY